MTVRKSVAGVSCLSMPVDTLVSLFPIIHQLVSNLGFTDKQVDWKKVFQCQVNITFIKHPGMTHSGSNKIIITPLAALGATMILYGPSFDQIF